MNPERKTRSDSGNVQINERDIFALTWIAEQFCISFDQLRRLLRRQAKAPTKNQDFLSVSATRNAIERWMQLELVETPRKIITEHPPYIWLSRRGLTQIGLPYSYYQPRPATIKHIYTTNNIRLTLEMYGLQTIWYSHRALIKETTERPLPDAELRAAKLPIMALRVIERPFPYDITVQEEITTLEILILRKPSENDQAGDATRYASLWYFLHKDALPVFQQALTTLEDQRTQQHISSRLVLYGLDAKELPADQQRTEKPLL